MVVGSRFFELPRLIWWWSKPDSFLILQTTVVLGTHGRQASHASSADVSESKSESGGEPPGVEGKGRQTQLQVNLSFPDRGQSCLA